MKRVTLFEESSDDDHRLEQEKIQEIKRAKLKNFESFANEIENTHVDTPKVVNEIAIKPIEIDESGSSDSNGDIQPNLQNDPSDIIQLSVPEDIDMKIKIDEAVDHYLRDLTETEIIFEQPNQALYFQWRLEYRLSSNSKWWPRERFRLQNGIIVNPPELLEFSEELDNTQGNDGRARFMIDFENIVRKLSVDRKVISEAMLLVLDYNGWAEDVAETMERAMRSREASFHQLLSRIYLVSDILYNVSCVRPDLSTVKNA